jgi:hypothetical protein
LCFATEFVGVECVGKVVVDVGGIECSDQIGKRMAIAGLIEAAKGRLAGCVDLVGKLGGRLLGEVRNGCNVVLVAVLERLLDTLVQLLVAAGGLDGPEVTSADDGRVLGVEVEGEVDLVEGA